MTKRGCKNSSKLIHLKKELHQAGSVRAHFTVEIFGVTFVEARATFPDATESWQVGSEGSVDFLLQAASKGEIAPLACRSLMIGTDSITWSGKFLGSWMSWKRIRKTILWLNFSELQEV